MAISAGTVQASSTVSLKGFKTGMSEMYKVGSLQAKKIERRFKDIGSSLTSVGKRMTKAITLPLIGAGALAVKTAADYETLRTSMDVLNGSAEEGARNFERLKEFSAGTPFQLQDLASAQNMLQGFGQTADDAFESIKMIGDISAVSGGSIEGIGIAFGQAAAEGKLMTRDIRQLINQGVPAIKLLADTMGVAQSEVFSLAEEGEISFDILQQSFRDATSEGGMFADGMAKQAQTIGGVFSTLKDNVSLALGELGQSISDTLDLKGMMKDSIARIQSIVKWFQSLSDEGRRSMIRLVAGIALVPPAIATLGVAFTAFGAIMGTVLSPIFLVTTAIASIATAGLYVAKNLDAIGALIKEEFHSWVVAALNTRTLLTKILLSMASLAPGIAGVTARAMNTAFKIEQGVFDENKAQFQSFGEFSMDVLSDIKDMVESMTGLDFSGMFSGGGDPAADIGMTTIEPIKRNLDELSKSIMDNAHVTGDFVSVAEMNLGKGATAWEDFVDKSKAAGFDFISFLAGAVSDAISGFSETVGLALSGTENSFATGFERIMKIVLDFAKNLGNLLIGIGTAIQLVPGLQGPGGAYIAGGAALTALASGFSAGIDKRISNREQRAKDSMQMERAFSSALSKHTSALGPDEVYVMSQKGGQRYAR